MASGPVFTVECDQHGPAEHDEIMMRWWCLDCGRYITDEDVFRLVSRLPPMNDGSPRPVVIT